MAGLASSQGVLIGARAVQGLGGALMSAAALSILTVTFANGRERNIAMGIWGGLAGLGGTLGVVAGGMLVDALGWAVGLLRQRADRRGPDRATPVYVRESRAPASTGPRGRSNATGSVLGTGGLLRSCSA